MLPAGSAVSYPAGSNAMKDCLFFGRYFFEMPKIPWGRYFGLKKTGNKR
jgi:hypothetical protein